ncbi:inorganic triphosphatase [mine drainage metagenome]|uniref:Inorganic triphosphatase n=1 Tax=mine drainage metagenome TaxID=410659 RepID=A0A1J5T8I7_9ZZZZ
MISKVELKLAVACQDAASLLEQSIVMAASFNKPITYKLVTTYYDTPDLKLFDAGISLCIRHVAGRWIQSIKTIGHSFSGLYEYMESESEISVGSPYLTKISAPKLIKFLSNQNLIHALIPIFQTKVMHSEWTLGFNGGDKVELALDVGQLIVGKSHEPISEIKLALKKGSKGRLFDLAMKLKSQTSITLGNNSKMQYGYAYYREIPLIVYYAKPPKLRRNNDANSAFKKIAWECVNQLLSNQDMVLYGTDIEGLHQMRVALRRLRSAFTLFSKLIGRKNSVELLSELGLFADSLGKARDLDVFIAETLPAVMRQFQNHEGLLKLRDKALSAKAVAYVKVRTEILSQRYHDWVLMLADWLENERWHASINDHKDSDTKVLDVASASLTKHHKQLRRCGKHFTHMLPEERHATRIAAKKLRYAAEFFAGIYSPGKSRSFIKDLSRLQDCLGLLNDISSTEKLLHELIGPRPGHALDEALHIFIGCNACNVVNSLAQADHAWRKFTHHKSFWC